MTPIGAERQRLDLGHRGETEFAIEMRKQRAAARRLPSEMPAKAPAIHLYQQQIFLAGEMFSRGLDCLLGGGEMNVAIGQIDGRAAKNAVHFGSPPVSFRADFINEPEWGWHCHNIAPSTRILIVRRVACTARPLICAASYRDVMRNTENYLIDTADQCVRLARAGREMAAQLEAMSNSLMAKAVELDTTRQRDDAKQPDEVRKPARNRLKNADERRTAESPATCAGLSDFGGSTKAYVWPQERAILSL
jgi:hypothetical protein